MLALLNGLVFLGLALLLGGAFARRWLTPGSPPSWLLGVGLGGLLLGWGGQVTVTLSTLGLTAPGDALIYLTGTTAGRGMLTGLIGALLLLASELTVRPLSSAGPRPAQGWTALASLGSALLLAWGAAGVGHGAGHGPWVRSLHAAHALAMSVWLGGVLALLRVRPLSLALARRFTPAALLSVGVLAVTGLLMAGEHLTTPAQWTGSLYGQVLLVKLALVALALGAAVLVRRAFAARSHSVRLQLAREALLLMAVLGVTGVLSTQSPPPSEGHPGHAGPP